MGGRSGGDAVQPASVSRRWILLDRDGVINRDSHDYIKCVAEWIPLPGSLEAIARLCRAGYRVAVVTNQSALARGLIDEAGLDAIHDRLCAEVEDRGGRIDGIFVCPHHPDAGCPCRKPLPGLIEQAARALGFSAAGVPFVGDKLSDLQAARAAGCLPVLVKSGHEQLSSESGAVWQGVEIHRDLAAFVDGLLGEDGRL